jgi:hypothetical protein
MFPTLQFSFLDFQSPQVPLEAPYTSLKRRRRDSNIQFLPLDHSVHTTNAPEDFPDQSKALGGVKAKGMVHDAPRTRKSRTSSQRARI